MPFKYTLQGNEQTLYTGELNGMWIEKMFPIEVIEPEKMGCAAPVIFASKDEWSLQSWFRYRKLASVVVTYLYQVCNVEDFIWFLGEKTITST